MAPLRTLRSRPCRHSIPWRPRRADRYERRRPEKTPLHRFISRHLESWLATRSLGERPVATHVEGEFREYLRCGVLCFGFARARCTSCGHGFLVAFSCKGRGVCPSCTGRRMAQTAAHVADHVIPPVPVRQWVISVPKRLRGVLADRPAAITALTRIFLDEIERWLGATVNCLPEAAADMRAWQNSGFSIDASVRIALVDRDLPSYFKSLEHLLRYCARPALWERAGVRVPGTTSSLAPTTPPE